MKGGWKFQTYKIFNFNVEYFLEEGLIKLQKWILNVNKLAAKCL